jgi:hypothetical protein
MPAPPVRRFARAFSASCNDKRVAFLQPQRSSIALDFDERLRKRIGIELREEGDVDDADRAARVIEDNRRCVLAATAGLRRWVRQ